MLFNSNDFLVFFAAFWGGYLLAQKNLFLRNLLVVGASYVFYSWWDIRFTALLFFTSVLDFSVGWLLDRSHTESRRKALVVISVVLNLGVLGFFKYFNFFRESLEALLATVGGGGGDWRSLDVVLPVGISFYTFQSMSYVIDVYRRDTPASRNFLEFLAYVSFFPQLVAGPIERGTNLLPQFRRTLKISAADVDAGLWLVVWGLFKKVVLADNLAPLVELVYQNGINSGPVLIMGTLAFGLQIYCDFSGYCDVACGIARLLGFRLMLNFNLPYFSSSLRDFWRRWHISLSTWLRDYLYKPLGGDRKGIHRTYLNVGITMLLGGLWHGAALNFVLWGLWHGAGLIVARWWHQRSRPLLDLPAWVWWLATQAFVFYGWMLFRATSIDQILQFTSALGTLSVPVWWRTYLCSLLALASPLLAIQVWQWRSGRLDAPLASPRWVRAGLQGTMLFMVIAFWEVEAAPFIYFQF